MSAVKIENSWLTRLAPVFEQGYMSELRAFLKQQKGAGKRIYPPSAQIFRAFELTPFEAVKVVILGQDPYHGPNQAHGLSFSVGPTVPFPPSLQNIFKELESDLGIAKPTSGDLSYWAKQGVLLLNSVLTVEGGQASSHQGKGWERFTDEVIALLNRERQHLVFILWGSYAQQKGKIIDPNRHLIIKSAHPSPLSAYRGFFGSRPFSKTNEYLKKNKCTPIDWRVIAS